MSYKKIMGKSTMKAIDLLRSLNKKYQSKGKGLHTDLIDLEKCYDCLCVVRNALKIFGKYKRKWSLISNY